MIVSANWIRDSMTTSMRQPPIVPAGFRSIGRNVLSVRRVIRKLRTERYESGRACSYNDSILCTKVEPKPFPNVRNILSHRHLLIEMPGHTHDNVLHLLPEAPTIRASSGIRKKYT